MGPSMCSAKLIPDLAGGCDPRLNCEPAKVLLAKGSCNQYRLGGLTVVMDVMVEEPCTSPENLRYSKASPAKNTSSE